MEKLEQHLTKRKVGNRPAKLTVRDYDADWEQLLRYPVTDRRMIAGAFTDWDNTARNRNGLVYAGAEPEKFGAYMKRLADKVKQEYTSPYIFINAWNEWAEGAYLEPDEKYGYAYLEALRDALTAEHSQPD